MIVQIVIVKVLSVNDVEDVPKDDVSTLGIRATAEAAVLDRQFVVDRRCCEDTVNVDGLVFMRGRHGVN